MKAYEYEYNKRKGIVSHHAESAFWIRMQTFDCYLYTSTTNRRTFKTTMQEVTFTRADPGFKKLNLFVVDVEDGTTKSTLYC